LASKAFTTFAAQKMIQQPRNCSKSDCFRVLQKAGKPGTPQVILSGQKGFTGVIVKTVVLVGPIGCTGQAGLEGQDFPCMYLAQHEFESINIIIIYYSYWSVPRKKLFDLVH